MSAERRFAGDLAGGAEGPRLMVYVESGCSSCGNALEFAERVRRELPAVTVEVVDITLSSDQRPDGVFAVPTIVLDGKIVSLGTPTWQRLAPLLREAVARVPRRAAGRRGPLSMRVSED